MLPTTIPDTSAPTQYVQLADSLGRLILIPAATVQALLAAGLESISLDVPLPGARQGGEWLTVTEAARLHLGDLPGISLENAKSKISRACESGKNCPRWGPFSLSTPSAAHTPRTRPWRAMDLRQQLSK